MGREEYEALPAPVRERVSILAACPTEEAAEWLFRFLPQTWRNVSLAWCKGEPTRAVVFGPEERAGDVIDGAILARECGREDAVECVRDVSEFLELWRVLTPGEKQVALARLRYELARGGSSAA
jgi:hypothetical protein